ncbi:conserved hypothetical protein [Gammaproteobacteria bacterium]
MSHFTRVKTMIRDQTVLEEALRQLNYEFQSGENLPIQGLENVKQGQVVIETGSRYNIGYQRQADQTYVICADWWAIQRNTPIRQESFMEEINRTYAHLIVKHQVLEQGLIIEEEKILPNGEIELVVCERF